MRRTRRPSFLYEAPFESDPMNLLALVPCTYGRDGNCMVLYVLCMCSVYLVVNERFNTPQMLQLQRRPLALRAGERGSKRAWVGVSTP